MAAPDIPALRDLRTRRLRSGEFFDAASALFREQAGPLLLLAALINLPLAALEWWGTRNAGADPIAAAFIEVPVDLAVALVAIIGWTAYALLTAERIEGRAVQPVELLRRATALWLPMLLTSLVGGFIVFCLLLCFIVPGVIFAVYYTFILQAVALRGRRLTDALAFSKALVTRHWMRTAGIVFVMALPLLTLNVILGVPAALFRNSLGLRLATGYLTGLAEAFWYIALTLFFLNEEAARAREAGAGSPGMTGAAGLTSGAGAGQPPFFSPATARAPEQDGPIYPP